MEYLKQLKNKTGNMPIILNGAAGAILYENKLLLVFHKNKQQWQIPGGLQEFGETLEDTVSREIKEELNLTLYPKDLIAVLSDIKWGWKYPDGFQIHPVTAFYLMDGNIDLDEIVIQEDEVEGYSLFDIDNIPSQFQNVRF